MFNLLDDFPCISLAFYKLPDINVLVSGSAESFGKEHVLGFSLLEPSVFGGHSNEVIMLDCGFSGTSFGGNIALITPVALGSRVVHCRWDSILNREG